jgi:RNA polymerase sporulation-specific sigma factor
VYIFLGYLSSSNSFPKPLTNEEEKLYLTKYFNGDEEAKNILIERNLRLVAHIIKKYCNSGKEMEDLISIGTIGLIKAIKTYDLDKGTRLATYAARCIENEVLMTIRANKKRQNVVSLQDPIGVDKEGNEISLIDILSIDEESVLDEVAQKIQIKNLYNKMKDVLKSREKNVLQMRYGLVNGHVRTQREIAQMLGISRSYVSRIEKKAINRLSKELKTK